MLFCVHGAQLHNELNYQFRWSGRSVSTSHARGQHAQKIQRVTITWQQVRRERFQKNDSTVPMVRTLSTQFGYRAKDEPIPFPIWLCMNIRSQNSDCAWIFDCAWTYRFPIWLNTVSDFNSPKDAECRCKYIRSQKVWLQMHPTQMIV